MCHLQCQKGFYLILIAKGDDENNIMAGVEAKEVGAKRCFSVVGRPDYGNVVGKIGIDFAVSERQVMAKQLLGLLTGQNVISRYVMPNGRIGIYEIEVEPDSPAVTMNLADLPLPDPCLIAAMMRDRYSRVPEAGDRLQTGDLVVVFMDASVVAQTIPFFQMESLIVSHDSSSVLASVLKTDQRLIDFVTCWLTTADHPEKSTHTTPVLFQNRAILGPSGKPEGYLPPARLTRGRLRVGAILLKMSLFFEP